MGNFFTEEQEAEIKRLCYESYLEKIRERNSKAFQEVLDNSFWGLNHPIVYSKVEKDSPLDNLLRHFGLERTKR